MNNLSNFHRLETHGIWRESENDPGRSAIILLSERRLTIVSKDNRPLSEWLLEAVRNLNPGANPAVFTPDDEGEETVTISDEQFTSTLLNMLHPKVSRSEAQQPSSWGVRLFFLTGLVALIASIVVFEDRIAGSMAGFIPAAQKLEIGERIFNQIAAQSGSRCRTFSGDRALQALSARLLGSGWSVRVIGGDSEISTHLPGRILVVSNALLKKQERLLVFGGYLVEERMRAQMAEPMVALLRSAGLRSSTMFVLRNNMDESILREFAGAQLSAEKTAVDPRMLASAFSAAGVPFSPIVNAAGSTTTGLAFNPEPSREDEQLISDRDWQNLRSICWLITTQSQ